MLRNVITRYHAADGGTSGAGDEDEADHSSDTKASDILSRYGQTSESALRMAEKLAEFETKNYHLRRKNARLTEERDALQSKQPGDGARVLSADEAKAYDAYVALGKAPAELKQALEASGEAITKLSKLERDAQIRDAATAHGYSPAALGKLPSLASVALLLKDEQIDGKEVRRAYVADGGTETALDAYIQAHDPEFLPSLTVQSAPAAPAAPTAPRGTFFVEQHAGSAGAAPRNAGEAYINRRYNNQKDK